MLKDISRKSLLVLELDIHELFLSLLIVRKVFQLGHLRKIDDPLVSDLLGDPFRQKRICMHKESSLSNTVGLVIELLGHHLIEILEFSLLKDLGMELGNTVYGMAAHDRKMSHLDLIVIENGHASYLGLNVDSRLVGVLTHDLIDKPSVYLINYLIDSRKKSLEQVNRPFLQRFRHYRMVCIAASL